MLLNKKSGAILIISLWIATILVVFSLSIAYRVNIGLKLTKLYKNKLEARAVCEGALFRIIEEKRKDSDINVDYFAESWSAKIDEEAEEENQPYFKDRVLGSAKYTISYSYRQSLDDTETTKFYGLQDEQSKFNINNIIKTDGSVDEDRKTQFENLLTALGKDKVLADNLKIWINSNERKFSSLEELQEIGVFDRDVLYTYDKDKNDSVSSNEVGLLEYITIYGDGKININTASKEVLLTVFSTFGFVNTNVEGLVTSILDGRRGTTKPWDTPFSNVDTLDVEIDSGELDAFNRLSTQYLTVSSLIYRAKISAQVRNVTKDLEAVLKLETGNKPQILYWHEK